MSPVHVFDDSLNAQMIELFKMLTMHSGPQSFLRNIDHLHEDFSRHFLNFMMRVGRKLFAKLEANKLARYSEVPIMETSQDVIQVPILQHQN